MLATVLTLGVAIFVKQLGLRKAEIENTLASRHALVVRLIEMQRDRLAVMRSLLLQAYQVSPQQDKAFAGYQLTQHSEWNIWDMQPEAQPAIGQLTGLGKWADASQQEMVAALNMDAQLQATLGHDLEVARLYYQSASQFVYTAPASSATQFRFKPALYKKAFWQAALPAANPTRHMVLAGPHQDLAGKGRLLTFALPVYHQIPLLGQDKFLGVVALDISMTTLDQVMQLGQAIGASMLLSTYPNHDKTSLPPSLSLSPTAWQQDATGQFWLGSPVLADQWWLAHQVTPSALYLAAARDSVPAWLSIILLALLAVLGWYFKAALATISHLTHYDALTQLLNRRGFYDRVATALALSRRNQLAVAVLMMEIDFFRDIHDRYGHAEAEAVLQQLSTNMLSAMRPVDVVCRWGGEQFVLVMLLHYGDNTLHAAERIRQAAQSVHIQPGHQPLHLSGGLVMLQDDEAIDAAIQRADLLLQQAKQQGRNRIVTDSVAEILPFKYA